MQLLVSLSSSVWFVLTLLIVLNVAPSYTDAFENSSNNRGASRCACCCSKGILVPVCVRALAKPVETSICASK